MDVFEKTYDAVVPIGQWCAPTMCLKKLGFRTASFPFDWMGHFVPLRAYAEVLAENGFAKMFVPENMRKLGDTSGEGTEHWKDMAGGWEIRHEFRVGVPFDENYANFRAQLDRRAARLVARLRSGGRFLLVHWHGGGRYAADEVVDAARLVRAAYHSAEIDLLVIETEKHANAVTFEEPERGVTIAVGDFYDQDRYDAVVGNEKLALSVFRRIHMRGRTRNLLKMKINKFLGSLRGRRRNRRGGVGK